jgi:hypothetical protein
MTSMLRPTGAPVGEQLPSLRKTRRVRRLSRPASFAIAVEASQPRSPHTMSATRRACGPACAPRGGVPVRCSAVVRAGWSRLST